MFAMRKIINKKIESNNLTNIININLKNFKIILKILNFNEISSDNVTVYKDNLKKFPTRLSIRINQEISINYNRQDVGTVEPLMEPFEIEIQITQRNKNDYVNVDVHAFKDLKFNISRYAVIMLKEFQD